MKNFHVIFMTILFILFFSFSVSATELTEPSTEHLETTEYPDDPSRAPDIVADSAIVIDASTGQVLFEKNANAKKFPASTTKILTVLIALEHNVDFNDTITMSENAIWGIDRNSTHIALDVGEQISVEDCIYATLLQSANECAYALAEYVAGDVASFSELMNQKAKELGCKNTHFVTPNGLHDDNHYTTAYDMALITQAAIKNEKFREITASLSYKIPATNLKDEPRELWQGNKMINPTSSFYYEYCEGGKTGYTEKANNTLSTFSKKDGLELICIILDSDGWRYNYTDSKALYNYCYNNYTYFYPLTDFSFESENKNVINKNHLLNNYYTSLDHQIIDFKVDKSFPLLVKKSIDTTKINYEINLYNKPKNKSVGEIIFSYEDETLGKAPIYNSNSFLSTKMAGVDYENSISIWEKVGKITFTIFIIICSLLIILLIYMVFAAIVRNIKRNHNRRRRFRRYKKYENDNFYF